MNKQCTDKNENKSCTDKNKNKHYINKGGVDVIIPI